MEQRPACAVAGVERIEDFASEVEEAKLVEPLRVVASVEVEGFALGRSDVGVVRPRFGREVIRRVAAHLVEVDEHLGEPLQVRAHVTAGLGLRQREPVSVKSK